MRAILLVALLALSACTNPVVVGCPKPAEYPREFQAAILSEVALLPEASPLKRAMQDYLKLRDQARACARG